jgi:hypothetical protein
MERNQNENSEFCIAENSQKNSGPSRRRLTQKFEVERLSYPSSEKVLASPLLYLFKISGKGHIAYPFVERANAVYPFEEKKTRTCLLRQEF